MNLLGRARKWLPQGSALPDDVWAQRHRWILTLLWLHTPFIFAYALLQRVPAQHAATEVFVIIGLALLATGQRRRRRLSTVITSVGLLTCSAVMVHLSHGLIEMHFHYFVMVGVITLYQDWWPFLIAIGYVVMQHGVGGLIDPVSVYNHKDAIKHPWEWAGIHGMFVLGMSAAGVASWRLNEAFLFSVVEREQELSETLSLLSATLDSTADGILVVDGEGRIASFNHQFVELWQIPAELLESRDDAALAFVVGQVADPELFTA